MLMKATAVHRSFAAGRLRSFEVLLAKDPLLDLPACPPKVLCYILENRGQSPDSKRVVTWDGDMVLSGLFRGEPQVASRLAGQAVTEGGERLGKVLSRNVTGKPHTARSSSRTKWSRISFGLASSSSKWQRTASRTCS